MSENTDQIRRETEAKWSGALSAITKQLPTILATVAVGLSAFNGCRVRENSTELNQNVKWIGQHLSDKQQEIDQLKQKENNDTGTSNK